MARAACAKLSPGCAGITLLTAEARDCAGRVFTKLASKRPRAVFAGFDARFGTERGKPSLLNNGIPIADELERLGCDVMIDEAGGRAEGFGECERALHEP